MSQVDAERRLAAGLAGASRTAPETRIDAAHLIPKPEPPSDEMPGAPETLSSTVETSPGVSPVEQLRTQAAQLAALLRARQQDLDHREARLNAQLAEWENEVRTARMALAEQAEQLAQRQQEAAQVHEEFQQRLSRLATAEAALQRREELVRQLEAQWGIEGRHEWLAELGRREEKLQHERQRVDAHREASLQLIRQLLAAVERRRQAVEAEAHRRLERARQAIGRLDPQALAQREKQLEAAEAELAEARHDLERLRQELQRERRKVQDEARAQRQRIAAEHRKALAELEEKRNALARRSEQVDQCHAALVALRGELEAMHRETLEMRLAAEELWAQLSGAAPPAVLSRYLAQVRAKLAESQRQAQAQVAADRQQLEALRRELAEQHARLVRQKRKLERWATRRQRQIQQQEAQLIARQEQLQARSTDLGNLAQQWQAEQLAMQQEVRRLRAQLRKQEEARYPAELAADATA